MKKLLCNVAGFSRITAKATPSTRIQAIALLSLLLPAVAGAQIVPDTLLEVRDSNHITRMRLYSNGGLYVGGNFDTLLTGSGGIPVQGAGTRMMWYPDKAAFRAGRVTGTQWDDASTGYYSFAAGEDARASGDNSTALGTRCVASQVSSFSIGEQNTASGAASVAMGYHAHTNARQGSFVFADRSTVDTLRAGVNHSSNWRVSGGFRIFTASNLSTGVTIQSGASVSNWGQSNAVISTSTGALLSTGGVWTNSSDVNRKHLFENISGEDILLKVRNLPITKWSYRNENRNVKHIGPMAQDFYAAFGLGNDEKSIGTVDADGVALASIKALESRTSKILTELETLKAENEVLRKQLGAQEKPVVQTAGLSLPLILLLAGAGLAGFLLFRRRTATGVKG
jgi:hypothetical protein